MVMRKVSLGLVMILTAACSSKAKDRGAPSVRAGAYPDRGTSVDRADREATRDDRELSVYQRHDRLDDESGYEALPGERDDSVTSTSVSALGESNSGRIGSSTATSGGTSASASSEDRNATAAGPADVGAMARSTAADRTTTHGSEERGLPKAEAGTARPRRKAPATTAAKDSGGAPVDSEINHDGDDDVQRVAGHDPMDSEDSDNDLDAADAQVSMIRAKLKETASTKKLADKVEITIAGDVVQLTGTVASSKDKKAIERVVKSVSAGAQIDNQIVVKK